MIDPQRAILLMVDMKACLSRCMRCGSNGLEDEDIEKLVRGGDAASMRVRATVCHHCGERYLSEDTIRSLEQARRDLSEGKLTRFRTLDHVLAPRPDTGS